MLKRRHYIVLGLVVVLTLIILNLPVQTTARLKQGINSIFLPLLGLTSSSEKLAGAAVDHVLPRGELVRQNDLLNRENQRLRLLLIEHEEITRENSQLRQQLSWQRRQPWKMKLANVVLRDPANWWRSIQIDLGSRDGLSNNLPVITPEGLVGRISMVTLTHSQVLLVGDPNCRVAARVANVARDTGVVQGSGPLETDLVDLIYMSKTAQLKPGQPVVTSGEGGVFPKDIPIGRIVDSRRMDYGMSTMARVKLGVNLNALEQVWVLFHDQ